MPDRRGARAISNDDEEEFPEDASFLCVDLSPGISDT